ncbi:MAG: hypothetical protein AAFR99_06690, partial [Cyanobacteria bacterium J06629_9]
MSMLLRSISLLQAQPQTVQCKKANTGSFWQRGTALLGQMLLLTTMTSAGVMLNAATAQARIETFEFEVFRDGSADPTGGPDPSFPAGTDPNAGNDTDNGSGNDPGNGIVRTLDIVTYRGTYGADQQGSEGSFTISFTIEEGPDIGTQQWLDVDDQLNCPNATLSNNDKTITCTVNSATASETGSVRVSAMARGDNEHGETLKTSAVLNHTDTNLQDPTATVKYDGGVSGIDQDPDDDGNVEVRVSATPKADLVKNNAQVRRLGQETTGDPAQGQGSVRGAVYVFPLSVIIDGGVGSEALQGNITITDDISGLPSGSKLYTWGGNVNGCAPNDQPSSGIGSSNDLPTGNIAWDNDEESVANSGTWTCSQTGTNITITIAGADTTGNHRPSETRNGNSLNADDTWLISGGVAIWIPVTGIGPNEGDSTTVTNRYEALTTNSIGGRPNQEPDTDNNEDEFELTRPAPGGGVDKFYRNVYDPTSSDDNIRNYSRTLYPMTNRRSGDGVVVPGQAFSAALNLNNSGLSALDNAVMCEAVDNLTQRVADPSLHSNFSNFAEINDDGGEDVVIEYAAGGTGSYVNNNGATVYYYATYEDQRTATCEDADAIGGWHPDPNQVPGGLEAITRVRIYPRATSGSGFGSLPEGERIRVALHLEALSRDPRSGTLYPTDGSHILPNHMTWSTTSIQSVVNSNGADRPGWSTDNYNPYPGSENLRPNNGDRLFLVSAVTRIEKTVNGSETATAAAESQVQFELQPTITAFSANPPAATLIVEDSLPSQFVYVLDSANIPPVSIGPDPNTPGNTLVTWNLGEITPGTVIAPITFNVTIRPDNEAGDSQTNTATVAGFDRNGDLVDNSSEALRTDGATVRFSNTSKFRIFKLAPFPLVELDRIQADDNNASVINTDDTIDVVYDLFFSNLQNTTVGATDFIDILPYNGDANASPDGRTPTPSNFDGDLFFHNISEVDPAGNAITTNGFTYRFTRQERSSLNQDPTDASNDLSTGSTKWCTVAEFGTTDCPTDNTEVTAVRISMTAFPGGDDTRQVRLTLRGSDMQGGNTYTNDFSGKPPGLQLITAVDAIVRTVGRPELVLVKRLTAINGTRFNDEVDDATAFDNQPNWPDGFLLGQVIRDGLEPGDEVEYTIYFMSNGFQALTNSNICDMVPEYTSYVPGSMEIALGYGSATSALTDTPDTDNGRFFGSPDLPAVPCPQNSNNQGAVVFNLVSSPNTLPIATDSGTPTGAFGFVRFRVT